MEKKDAVKKNICCCCGLFPATEPNGLCTDCAEHCAGFILKDKPCMTVERHYDGPRASDENDD